MTVLTTVLLALGMALVGVHVLAIVANPVGALVITRISDESSWDVYMTMWSQFIAAAVTFAVGYLALSLPWYAALIAAFLVGITTYARRAPEPASLDYVPSDYYTWDDADDAQPHRRERTLQCQICGKWLVDTNAMSQHIRAKHADVSAGEQTV